jgi:hypothetical protein
VASLISWRRESNSATACPTAAHPKAELVSQRQLSQAPIGYALDTIQLSTPTHIYPLNFSLTAGTFITTKLVWDWIVNEINAANGTAGVVNTGDSFSLNSLNGTARPRPAKFFTRDLPIASSISIIDNVEHLHIPIGTKALRAMTRFESPMTTKAGRAQHTSITG